jgi:hypothetical protein
MDPTNVIAIVFGSVGAVLGFVGWRKAVEANRIAATSNTIAQDSKTVAEDSNRIAVEANELAREANTYVSKATEIASETLEHQLRRDQESKQSHLQFPEGPKGSLWFKEQSGKTVIVAIPLHNVGLGTARNISPKAFINEVQVAVEGEPTASLKHDEVREEAFWLRIQVDDLWIPPEGKTIRLVLTYADGTGPRITERCFRFYGDTPQRWESKQFPCYSSGPP